MSDNRTWSEFFIEDIATISSGRDINESERRDGDTPYISATSLNNGVGYFVGNHNTSLESNCLSVNRNGSVGYSFYHPYSGLFSNDCRKLKPIEQSSNIGVFLSHQITAQKDKYNYGYKMGTARLKRQKIMLPIVSTGAPDWNYMEQFVADLIARKKIEYARHCKDQLAELIYVKTKSFSELSWKEFFIEDLFETRSGKRLTKTEMVDGIIPFIGASSTNNGVTGFISNTNESMDSNILGVNYNGSVGESFYHPYSAVFSDDVKRLCFIHIVGERFHYLFLKNAIMHQKDKYQYAYKFNEKRMKRQKIMLPVSFDGEPDYHFMKQYMMNLEYIKRAQYLKHSGLDREERSGDNHLLGVG